MKYIKVFKSETADFLEVSFDLGLRPKIVGKQLNDQTQDVEFIFELEKPSDLTKLQEAFNQKFSAKAV